MTCCFIGHRKINETPELKKHLTELLSGLIEEGMTDFIFGDHSAFDDLCYRTVSELKKPHPHIKRIYFRKDYEDADEYTSSLLETGYEESICPAGISKAGKASYVERNQSMIRESDVCVFYYNESYLPSRRKESRKSISDYQPKSGTAIAYAYALKLNKKIYNLFFSEKTKKRLTEFDS